MWERYCRGVNAILYDFEIVNLLMSRYVVDSAEAERIPESKEELFELLERPVLAGIPLLVLGNKNDLREAIPVEKLIDEMFVLFKVEIN
jgi:ADP-ribosylation factor-like protein 8